MSQRTKKTVSFVTFLFALALGAFVLRAGLARDADATPDAPALTMEGDVEVLLLRMGLSPVEFAASAISGTTMQTALATEQNELEGAVLTLSGHDESCADAQVTADALFRKIQRRRATQQEIDQYPIAKEAHESALASRASFLDGMAAALFENFSHAQRTTLVQIRENQPWKHLPAQYRVLSGTQAEWLEIKNALAAKRTHDDIGDETPQEVLDFLAILNSNTDVATAAANIDALLAGVQAAWDAIFNH